MTRCSKEKCKKNHCRKEKCRETNIVICCKKNREGNTGFTGSTAMLET